MKSHAIHTSEFVQTKGGPQPATAFDVDICTCQGSVAVLPKTKSARLYCSTALAGWACAAGVYFIPRTSADLILRTLTKRFSCRVDREIVS
jgi:hypothetical protein